MSRAPKLTLNLQFPAAKTWPEHKALLPRATVAGWIKAALFADGELTVRFVDAEEGRTLNCTYRGKDYSTNVLTFAYAESEDDPVTGDLILCCPVVEKKPPSRASRCLRTTRICSCTARSTPRATTTKSRKKPRKWKRSKRRSSPSSAFPIPTSRLRSPTRRRRPTCSKPIVSTSSPKPIPERPARTIRRHSANRGS